MTIDNLISRLQKVRKSRNGQWTACCPAHEDRHPSLSIREESDGRVLINCMAGCSPFDIVSAVGLEMTDLFPEREETHHLKRGLKQRIPPADALRIIAFEATVVLVAAGAIRDGTLTQNDMDRLTVAASRIQHALELSDVRLD
jgi:hypothetical protein